MTTRALADVLRSRLRTELRRAGDPLLVAGVWPQALGLLRCTRCRWPAPQDDVSIAARAVAGAMLLAERELRVARGRVVVAMRLAVVDLAQQQAAA